MSRIGPIVIEIQPPSVRVRRAKAARQVFRGYEDGYQGCPMDPPEDETLRKAYYQAYDDGREGRLAEWADENRKGYVR